MESQPRDSNRNTAFMVVALAGGGAAFLIAYFGGRFNSGWPLAAMVAAPALMAIAIAYFVSKVQ